jgi:hypothetical protein
MLSMLLFNFVNYVQWNLGSRTIRFTNKFSKQKTPRITNGVIVFCVF